MSRAMAELDGISRGDFIQVPPIGMASSVQIELVVARAPDPALRGRFCRFLLDGPLEIRDGPHPAGAAVDGNEAGRVAQHVAMGIDESRDEGVLVAVDSLSLPALHPGQVLRPARVEDSTPLHRHQFSVGLDGVQSNHPCIVEYEVWRNALVHSVCPDLG